MTGSFLDVAQRDAGVSYLNSWPSARAMASIKAKIRERTTRRFVSRDLRYVVEDLNPVLRGWGNYFRHGASSRKFALVDSYVHQRLSKLASAKYGLRDWNRGSRFGHAWLTSLGIYRLTGKVRYRAASA